MNNGNTSRIEKEIAKWREEKEIHRVAVIEICKDVQEILSEMDDVHEDTMKVFARIEAFLEENKPCGK